MKRFALPVMAAVTAGLSFGFASTAVAKDDKAATVQAHVDAYRSGDLDRFVRTFAKDATVIANGIKARGHTQIKAFYWQNFKEGAPSIRVTESGKVGSNIYIVTAYDYEDGRTLCCAYSEYVVRDGKITYLVTGN